MRMKWVAGGAGATALLVAAAWLAYDYPLRPSRVEPQALARFYAAQPARPATPVAAADIDRGIALAVDYILRAQRADGSFVYLVNTDPAVPVPPGYNLLRHAGAIYALGMAHAWRPDPRIERTMAAALDFMRRCCLQAVRDGEGMGITEPPAVVPDAGPLSYKLGGAGLGLVAMASLARSSPGAPPVEEMQGLARFGHHMMRWNGEFHARHVPSAGGRIEPGQALFYPGEMVLGWLLLHERQPSPELIEWSVRALSLLARRRAAAGEAPADHWALLATARLFAIADRERLDIPRQRLLDHALQICHTMLEDAAGEPAVPSAAGSLVSRGWGEVTATSTVLEGLLAALAVLPSGHPMVPHVIAAVHRGMAFVLRAQWPNGQHAGGIPMAIERLAGDGRPETVRFNANATEIRIDYVQHALSALLQYRQLGLAASR